MSKRISERAIPHGAGGGSKRLSAVPPDYAALGQEIDIPLLRALALGRKSSAEIQLLLDSVFEPSAHKSAVMNNGQMLALLLADLSVPEEKSAITFKRLIAHQKRMKTGLGRPVGIKTAALDFLEHTENALKIRDDENQLTYSQLTQMAFTDQLTGLANYRFFMQRLREEYRRCERYGHLLSLLMVNLDFFKKFNDRHGHPAGNKALQQISRALFAEVRETDLLARYGGEEFALILPHTSKLEAAGLAERIRARAESTLIMSEGRSLGTVTLSLGVATLPRDARNEEALLVAADQALYTAKHSGRNRVELFVPKTSGHFRFAPPPHLKPDSVCVIGDFNDWQCCVDVMKPNARGLFELDVPLVAGRYLYKLVLNEKDYIPDSAAKENEPDGQGGLNSVLIVK